MADHDPIDPNDPADLIAAKIPKASSWPLVIAAALVAGGAAGLGIWWMRLKAPEVDAVPPPVVAAAPAAPVLAPPPLPPVEEADTLIRGLLEGVSRHPKIAAWLATPDLARRFVSAVDQIAEGGSPRTSLSFLAPAGKFQVVQRDGKTFIDEKSFQRYDEIADAIGSLDVQAVAKAYESLRTLFGSAYHEIGRPGTALESRLAAAVLRLTSAPIPAEPIEVVAPRVAYLYADPALEALPAASKHLLRMGPRNQRIVQQKLKELAGAIHLELR